jgi:electron transport complex protein RnfE
MSTTPRQDLARGVWRENPVLVQTLGMCPTLAITNTVANCVVMGVATTFVLVFSCVLASLWRRRIPNEVRITAFVLIIATFVTVADMLIEGLVPTVHRSLGPFIALIVVNCIILARQEAFAFKNPVGRSFLDAVGSGAGFTIALFWMGVVREVLGAGTFLGARVFGEGFQPWTVMAMPPGGFLTLALILLVVRARDLRRKARRPAKAAGEAAPAAVGRAA